MSKGQPSPYPAGSAHPNSTPAIGGQWTGAVVPLFYPSNQRKMPLEGATCDGSGGAQVMQSCPLVGPGSQHMGKKLTPHNAKDNLFLPQVLFTEESPSSVPLSSPEDCSPQRSRPAGSLIFKTWPHSPAILAFPPTHAMNKNMMI